MMMMILVVSVKIDVFVSSLSIKNKNRERFSTRSYNTKHKVSLTSLKINMDTIHSLRPTDYGNGSVTLESRFFVLKLWTDAN